jgi:large subunit ribosomal protein L17
MKRKFGRKKDHRESMMANLVTSLILYEKIQTTKTKAKETATLADKMITLAKSGTLSDRRYLLGYLKDKNATKKLFENFVPRFKKRNSGFTKIYKLGHRVGDGAPMVILRFIKDETLVTEEVKPENAAAKNITKPTVKNDVKTTVKETKTAKK